MTRREFFQRRIPRYRKDPLLFFKEVTHFEPDPWQREAAVAVSQHRRVAIRSGQGVGKTALEANLMWWFIACFSYPRIVCTAPTMQQLDNVLWAEMAKWLDASPVLQMMFTWTKTRVYMNGYDRRWFAVPRTATKPESLQGFHEDNMLFVVDEASGVADPAVLEQPGAFRGLCRRQPAPWSFNCPGPHTGLSRRPPMDPRTFKRAPGASYPIRQLYPRHSVRTVCHHAVQCLRLYTAGCRRYNSPSAVSDFCSCIKCGFRSGFYHVLWLGHRRSRLCYGSVPGGGGLLKPDLYVLQIPDLPLLPG